MNKAPIIHCPYKPDKSDDEIYCDIGEFKMDLFNKGTRKQRAADHQYYLKWFIEWLDKYLWKDFEGELHLPRSNYQALLKEAGGDNGS